MIIFLLQSQDELAVGVVNWVEPLMHRFRKEGLLVGYYEGGGYHDSRSQTRYEYAVATHATFMQLTNIVQVGEKHGITGERQLVVVEWSRWAPACLLTLADEFRRELTSMGVETSGLIKELSQLKSRMTKLRVTGSFFSDVPVSHWAAGAVTEMGKKGLLKGYPGRKFINH